MMFIPNLEISIAYYIVIIKFVVSVSINELPLKDFETNERLENPVKLSGTEDEIVQLANVDTSKLNFKQYSGYLHADEETPGRKFLHYWLVESQLAPKSSPLVFWLGSGESGCSNMISLLTEIGPFKLSNTNGSLEMNPHTWNRRANLVFMDGPAGIGYSYRSDGVVLSDDDEVARQQYFAVKSFMRKFPQFGDNPVYLAGRFWAGIQVPLLGLYLDRDGAINLQGLLIGNGYLDMSKNDAAMIFKAYYHGIISDLVWQDLLSYCCLNRSPSWDSCNFWPPLNQHCINAMNEAALQIFNIGLNVYNLNEPCTGDNRSIALRFANANYGMPLYAKTTLLESHYNLSVNAKSLSSKSSACPLCNSYESLNVFMNKKSVRDALHIPEDLHNQFAACNKTMTDHYEMLYPYEPNGMGPQVLELLASDRQLDIMFYSGDADLACPLLATRWFVDNLRQPAIEPYGPWLHEAQVAGFRQQFNGIKFMTVKGAGQMVAVDKPAEALLLFESHFLGLY